MKLSSVLVGVPFYFSNPRHLYVLVKPLEDDPGWVNARYLGDGKIYRFTQDQDVDVVVVESFQQSLF